MTGEGPQGTSLTQITPMWLRALPSQAKRLVIACASRLLALSDEASERYATHQARIATVEAYKQSLAAEGLAMAATRKKLLASAVGADDITKVRIQSDLKFLEEEARKYRIYLASFDHLQDTPQSKDETTSIEPAWLDRFDEYTRKQNEPWRADLLAKALAMEAVAPGSVGTRALWVIGTMEEQAFHAFAAVLNLCSFIGDSDSPMIPDPRRDNQLVPDCAIGPRRLNNLVFKLNPLGLLAGPSSFRLFQASQEIVAKYGNKEYALKFTTETQVYGLLLSDLGTIIAKLYSPQSNALGSELFEDWIKRLPAEVVQTTLPASSQMP